MSLETASAKLDEIEKRYDELEAQLNDPVVCSDHKQYLRVARSKAELENVALAYKRYRGILADIPVAEEAVVTATMMGNPVDRLYDVGVAGIHRLLGNKQHLDNASAIIVVAGMEGALPSVVGGLVAKPVIAVPTSIGYGASFKGLAALLGMLNSCAAGVTVVNIDNGFGAGFAASLINRV